MILTTDVLIIAAVVLLVAAIVWDRIRVMRRVKKIEKQVGSAIPYWQAMQAKLIVDLTHPHAERVDELLQILKADPLYEMSDKDRTELLEGLARRAAGDDPKIDIKERRKAAIFPLVMEEVQQEAANKKPIESVQLIGMKKEE